MKNMKKTFALLMCLVLSMGVLAACGSEESSSSSSGSAASSGGKKYKIATDTVFKPFEYTNENNEFVGIDVDILAAVAKDQGFEYELNALGFDAAVAAVESGQADALIAGATINDERKSKGWIFSDGYYDATQTFAVKKGSDIKSYEDLKGKKVAVKNGTAGKDFAESLKDQYGFETTVFEDSPTMYQDVILGNSAACVEDTPIMQSSIKEGGLEIEIPSGMESEGAPYGFAIMNKDNQELLDKFNAGLKNIRESGEYQKILDKYLK